MPSHHIKSDQELLFSTFVNVPVCADVQYYNYSERCQFVRQTYECEKNKQFVNYMDFLYCVLKPHSVLSELWDSMVLLSICFVMFLILATTSDKIFCPALQVLANEFGMNEHLAGVTVLAFGNGSPDLFTSLASVNDKSRMLFSDLFGAAIYVQSFVGGLILVLSPFKLQPNNIARDVGFLAFSALYIDYCIVTDDCVTILECVAILMIYVVYLVVIILDQYLLKQNVKYMERQTVKKRIIHKAKFQELEELRSEANIEIYSKSVNHISITAKLKNMTHVDIEQTRASTYSLLNKQNYNIYGQVWETINPIDQKEWRTSTIPSRIIMVLMAPIELVLMLLIPVVDYELDRHGWSKLLNSLQLVWLPFITSCINMGRIRPLGIPIYFYSILITVPLSIYTMKKTRTDKPPAYHSFLAIYSAYGAMFVIYTSAAETVQILHVLGVISSCSNAFLGGTLLAWGNGIGDLVANLSLAKRGYQRMSYAACIGGPFFNSILSIGCTFLLRAWNSPMGTITVIRGALGENCLTFTVLGLFSTLFWCISTDFHTRRSTGLFSITFYCIFVLYAVLGEMNVVHTYARDAASGIA